MCKNRTTLICVSAHYLPANVKNLGNATSFIPQSFKCNKIIFTALLTFAYVICFSLSFSLCQYDLLLRIGNIFATPNKFILVYLNYSYRICVNEWRTERILCCVPFYTQNSNHHININCQNSIWHSLSLSHHFDGFFFTLAKMVCSFFNIRFTFRIKKKQNNIFFIHHFRIVCNNFRGVLYWV